MGTTHLEEIQLEEGSVATKYQDPHIEPHPIQAIIKSLKNIRFDMYDEEGKISAEFFANNMLWQQRYEDLETSTETKITQTANLIQQDIKNTKDGLSTQIIQTDRLVREKLADEVRGLNTEITRTASGIRTEISDEVKGLSATITTTASGIRTELADEVRGLNTRISALPNAWQVDIRDTERSIRSTLTSTADALTHRISNAEGRTSELSSTLSGLTYRLGTDSKVAQLVMNDSAFQRMISDATSGGVTSTEVSQTARSISLQILQDGTAINYLNMTPSGTRLHSKLLHITGQTLIENGVIKSAMIDSLSASQINTGTLNAANVRIINLDVNNLTGNKTQFMQSLWMAMTTNVYIDGTGVRVARYDGTTSVKVGTTGLDIHNSRGERAGHIGTSHWKGTRDPVLRLSSEFGTDTSFGVRMGSSESTFISRIALYSGSDRIKLSGQVEINGSLTINGRRI